MERLTSSNFFIRSNRRRCVKRKFLKANDNFISTIKTDKSSEKCEADNSAEETITVDLSAFLKENPYLAEAALENSNAIQLTGSSSQFRISNLPMQVLSPPKKTNVQNSVAQSDIEQINTPVKEKKTILHPKNNAQFELNPGYDLTNRIDMKNKSPKISPYLNARKKVLKAMQKKPRTVKEKLPLCPVGDTNKICYSKTFNDLLYGFNESDFEDASVCTEMMSETVQNISSSFIESNVSVNDIEINTADSDKFISKASNRTDYRKCSSTEVKISETETVTPAVEDSLEIDDKDAMLKNNTAVNAENLCVGSEIDKENISANLLLLNANPFEADDLLSNIVDTPSVEEKTSTKLDEMNLLITADEIFDNRVDTETLIDSTLLLKVTKPEPLKVSKRRCEKPSKLPCCYLSTIAKPKKIKKGKVSRIVSTKIAAAEKESQSQSESSPEDASLFGEVAQKSPTEMKPRSKIVLKTTGERKCIPGSARGKNYDKQLVLVPFTSGWRREHVLRATAETGACRKSDIYYSAPDNKKLRSMHDILIYLSKHPDIKLGEPNFTFIKELIFRPPYEVQRDAKHKMNTPVTKRKHPSSPGSKKTNLNCLNEFGKYPIIKLKKLNDNLVKNSKIKINNWSLNASPNDESDAPNVKKTIEKRGSIIGKYPIIMCKKLNINSLVKNGNIKISGWPPQSPRAAISIENTKTAVTPTPKAEESKNKGTESDEKNSDGDNDAANNEDEINSKPALRTLVKKPFEKKRK